MTEKRPSSMSTHRMRNVVLVIKIKDKMRLCLFVMQGKYSSMNTSVVVLTLIAHLALLTTFFIYFYVRVKVKGNLNASL